MRHSAGSQRVLYGAMGLVVCGFLASSVFSNRVISTISGSAEEILNDEAPSIIHLSAARSEMHDLEVLIADYVADDPLPSELESVNDSERRMEEEVANYEALPAIEPELSMLRQLQRD